VLGVALATVGAFPGSASAHGPVAPVALDYLARVASLPAGLDAKVVDGDQRMWLQVPAAQTVLVLDYAGAPYLRFSRAGIEVNQNSAMYYLNQRRSRRLHLQDSDRRHHRNGIRSAAGTPTGGMTDGCMRSRPWH
jgi:hypothetical protein